MGFWDFQEFQLRQWSRANFDNGCCEENGQDLIVVVGSSLEIAEGHTRLTVRLTALELGQMVSLMPNSACLMLKSLAGSTGQSSSFAGSTGQTFFLRCKNCPCG